MIAVFKNLVSEWKNKIEEISKEQSKHKHTHKKIERTRKPEEKFKSSDI